MEEVKVRYDLHLGFSIKDFPGEIDEVTELMDDIEKSVSIIDERTIVQYYIDEEKEVVAVLLEILDDKELFNKLKNAIINMIGEDVIKYKAILTYNPAFKPDFEDALYLYEELLEY